MADIQTTASVVDVEKMGEADFPKAVGKLLELNNYSVRYDVHIHGAQVDIVAQSLSDPFAPPIYVEATIEYVSTEKYGKDTTKFLLLKNREPSATCLCVSSQGFTAPVSERAKASGVIALSYREMFSQFEKFSPYVDMVLTDSELEKLDTSYEEPLFSDNRGTDYATRWLKHWKSYAPDAARWLIVLGEYGTGKTSLTRVLQRRWIQDYQANPSSPIPVRIELRNFSRQFDAQGLIHHFLDTNNLGHVPIQFVLHLIRTGRIILILDGYDEMAQFLNSRERRACLSALAELSADGAKGILTSRPNYFTDTEELNVFEVLYSSIEQNKYHLSKLDRSFVAQERAVDELVDRYVLNRFERSLQDLTPAQTEALVKRTLSHDPEGQALVLQVLQKVFRGGADGSKQALSGKPVIIAYLLELVDELRGEANAGKLPTLTEWQVYKLIVDRLMLRDLRRSALSPDIRRMALQKLALKLSSRDIAVADEQVFEAVIEDVFSTDLRRLGSPEEKRSRKAELYEDLRSSATLTRATGTKTDGSVFSHNSLREYLVVEFYLKCLASGTAPSISVPVSAPMRAFAGSLLPEDAKLIFDALAGLWKAKPTPTSLGGYMSLLWDAFQQSPTGALTALRAVAGDHQEGNFLATGLSIADINLSDVYRSETLNFLAEGSELTRLVFDYINLSSSRFDSAVIDNCSFLGCNLSGSDFSGSIVFDCDFTDAEVGGARFCNIDLTSNIIAISRGQSSLMSGKSAVGYLKSRGAITDPVDDYFVYMHDEKFPIIEKICSRLVEQRNSQLRGLTQRGEARADPPFAREFIDRLVSIDAVTIDKNELVSPTPTGRQLLTQLATHQTMSSEIADFLAERR